MKELTLREQSSIISCEHMKALAQKERDYNHFRFVQHITTPTTNTIPCNSDDYLDKELKLLQGWKIDKNNCIYKSPEYNPGEWEKQFQRILPEEFGNKFNVRTKK